MSASTIINFNLKWDGILYVWREAFTKFDVAATDPQIYGAVNSFERCNPSAYKRVFYP